MPDYALTWSGGTIIVLEGTTDNTQTSLTLIGDGYQPWGRILNQDLVDLLQNFAAPSPPPNPLPGQLWYDTSGGGLSVWDGTTWKSLAGTIIQGPEDRIHDPDGDTWVSTTDTVNTVTVATGGTVRLRVEPSGDVGIGTSTPLARLHVQGSGSLLRLGTAGDPGLEAFSVGGGDVEITYRGSSDARIHLSPLPASPGEAVVTMFRDANTTGPVRLEIYDGTSAANLWGSLDMSGDGYLAATGRHLGVGSGFGSGVTPLAPLHVAADISPQVVVGNASSSSRPALAFRDEAAGIHRVFLALDTASGALRIEKEDGFAVLEIRQDGTVRVSSAYTLPSVNGNPNDILVSDGFGGTYWQPAPFGAFFDSGTITQTGASAYTVSHGLGAVPRMVRVTFVATANNNGYVIGDEIDVAVANTAGGGDGLLSVFASNVDVGLAISGNVYAVRKDGSGTFVISGNTSWGLRLRAWL